MRKRLANTLLLVIGLYLLLAFIFSSWAAIKRDSLPQVTSEQIVKNANAYLSDPILIRKGYKMDCSDYVTSVFKDFGILIPASAIEQYLTFKNYLNEPKPGNLVFFAIDHTKVNHVGVMINDSVFLHSPGINKYVRKENIKNNYWAKSFKGAVTVLNQYN